MYCTKCGKYTKDESSKTCKYCGEELVTDRELNEDETRQLSQKLYTRYNKSREEVDNSLVFIVLGATLLIVGVLFLYLSQKVNPDTFNKEITITCPEFWVSMTGLVVGGFLFVSGLVRLIQQKSVVQPEVKKTIKHIQNNTYTHVK